jgi:hypothetical protein
MWGNVGEWSNVGGRCVHKSWWCSASPLTVSSSEPKAKGLSHNVYSGTMWEERHATNINRERTFSAKRGCHKIYAYASSIAGSSSSSDRSEPPSWFTDVEAATAPARTVPLAETDAPGLCGLGKGRGRVDGNEGVEKCTKKRRGGVHAPQDGRHRYVCLSRHMSVRLWLVITYRTCGTMPATWTSSSSSTVV